MFCPSHPLLLRVIIPRVASLTRFVLTRITLTDSTFPRNNGSTSALRQLPPSRDDSVKTSIIREPRLSMNFLHRLFSSKN